jgi:hypothetical protein
VDQIVNPLLPCVATFGRHLDTTQAVQRIKRITNENQTKQNHAHFLTKTKVGKYTIHLETEAKFLDVIGSEVLRVFLLPIPSPSTNKFYSSPP